MSVNAVIKTTKTIEVSLTKAEVIALIKQHYNEEIPPNTPVRLFNPERMGQPQHSDDLITFSWTEEIDPQDL